MHLRKEVFRKKVERLLFLKKGCILMRDVLLYLLDTDTCFYGANMKGGEPLAEEKFYIVKKKAVPEVLLQVVEAKRLLDSERVLTVQEAVEAVGISRSSFYKYKDDIFPFHENNRGRTITFMAQMDDEPGLLSVVLGAIAKSKANILTIHQAIPIGGIASLTISIEMLPETEEVTVLMERMESITGVHYIKILGRE